MTDTNPNFLFGSSPAQGPTNVDSAVQGLPDYWQTYNLGLLNMGNQLAAQPYQAYPGQMIADLSPDQQQAIQLTEQNVGAATPYLTQAGNLYNQVGSGFNQNTFNQYMNPYNQDVVNALTNASNTNFSQNVMPQLNSQFISSGMYDGSRNAQVLSQAAVQNQQNLNNQIASTLQSGYNNAMNAYQTGNQQQLLSGQSLGQLGGQLNTSNLQNESALSAAGQQQQNQQQNSLNLGYQNFQEQQQYPYSQLAFLDSLMRGSQAAMPYSTQASQTGTATQPVNSQSPLSILGGSLLGLGSLQGTTV